MTANSTPGERQAVVRIDRLHIEGLAVAQVDAFSTALADELTQLAQRDVPLRDTPLLSVVDAVVIPALRITAPANSRPVDLARLVATSLHDRIGQ